MICLPNTFLVGTKRPAGCNQGIVFDHHLVLLPESRARTLD
jgi:hypothetical protein